MPLGKEVAREMGREVRAMRRMLLILVVALLLVGLTVTPAFAFIHVTIPAGDCAASDQAGENFTAGTALATQGAVFQGAQDFPIGNVTKAPTTCPAP
jgi:ABC-type enterobactin transport system permease subunit